METPYRGESNVGYKILKYAHKLRFFRFIFIKLFIFLQYSKREKQMNDYKQYKIEQERKREELERKNLAATRIQAWWRGTMVRKGFGKFRKKKEKKGKKKSSDKKPTKSTQ